MKHTYHITGMTCNGCKASVENSLKAIDHITKVEIDLENKQGTLTMNQHVDTATLQSALSEKYNITEVSETNVFKSPQASIHGPEVSELRQLFPLFLIFGYLIISAFLLNNQPWDGSGFMLDFMGLFYIVFSFFKFLDLKGFPESFKMYDPLARRLPAYGWVYPFIELGLGLMFLMRFEIVIALIVTLVILGITTIGVTRTLLDKRSIQCACLGTALKLPMTKATFIENSVMIVMAVIMLINLLDS